MTRRLLCGIPIAFAFSGCQDIAAFLPGLDGDLVILRSGLSVTDVSGTNIGMLRLQEGCYGAPSVAPDGNCLAWLPQRGAQLNWPRDSKLILAVPGSPSTELFLPQVVPSDISIAPNGQLVAFAGSDRQTRKQRLIVWTPSAGDGPIDLSGLAQSLDSELEQLRLSSSGRQLAVSTRTTVAVVNVESHNVVYKSPGRFASLSPDGSQLAFIVGSGLVIQRFKTGETRPVNIGWRTYGVGAWTPDSRFLLVAARTGLGWNKSLLVLDTIRATYAEVSKLGEGDFGSTAMWVRRALALQHL